MAQGPQPQANPPVAAPTSAQDAFAALSALGLAAYVEEHSITGDGERIKMRKFADIKEGLSVTQNFTCAERHRAMRNVFRYGAYYRRYG